MPRESELFKEELTVGRVWERAGEEGLLMTWLLKKVEADSESYCLRPFTQYFKNSLSAR